MFLCYKYYIWYMIIQYNWSMKQCIKSLVTFYKTFIKVTSCNGTEFRLISWWQNYPQNHLFQNSKQNQTREDSVFRTYLIHLDLHLQPRVCNLLHVLHSVNRESAVGQEHTANTLKSSTRRVHISWLPVQTQLFYFEIIQNSF